MLHNGLSFFQSDKAFFFQTILHPSVLIPPLTYRPSHQHPGQMVPVLRASSRVGAGHDLFLYTLGSILRDVFHIFVLHILIGQLKENRFSRSCPDREPVSGFCLCRGTGEDRKIGLRVADGLVIKRYRFFFYDQPTRMSRSYGIFAYSLNGMIPPL